MGRSFTKAMRPEDFFTNAQGKQSPSSHKDNYLLRIECLRVSTDTHTDTGVL
jgi:hypothetical protein